MKKLIYFITILLTICLPYASGAGPSGPLFGAQIFDSGPYYCDNVTRQVTWANNTGGIIYIHSIVIWVGVDGGALGALVDVLTYVTRTSDGMILSWYGQNVYADGRHPIEWDKYFLPDYVSLAAGDSLTILYWCTGTLRTHSAVRLWYQTY